MLFAKGVSQMIGKFLEVRCTQHGYATVSAQATCLSLPPTVQQKSRKGKHWQHGPPSCEMLPVQQESWFWFCVWDRLFFFVIYFSELHDSLFVIPLGFSLRIDKTKVWHTCRPSERCKEWFKQDSSMKGCDTRQCEDEAGNSPNVIYV